MSLGVGVVCFAPHIMPQIGSCNSFVGSKNFEKLSRYQLCSKAAFASTSSPGEAADYSGAEQLLSGGRGKLKKRLVAGVEQDELVEPHVLAEQDSCFCDFKGVRVHYKMCHHHYHHHHHHHQNVESHEVAIGDRIPFPIVLLHGFGASAFSWGRVMRILARLTSSGVVAFDRPGFGLTSRPHDIQEQMVNPYSLSFSVLITLHFIHLLAAQKAILIGHSAGALVALDTYFEAPERVGALILVAPAVFAPLRVRSTARSKSRMDDFNGNTNIIHDDESDSPSILPHRNPFLSIWEIFSRFFTYIASSVMKLLKRMMSFTTFLYKRALTAILRSTIGLTLVRMVIDKFGVAAIRNSWHDASQITEPVIHGYTKPLRSKNWDKALVEFTVAMLTDSSSESKPPLSQRLAEITCPVLIITGDNDRLVPSWNAERLSRVIPGSCLEVIRNCGHLPHEEKVEEFVSIVQKFLQRVWGPSEEQLVQAAIA
ncbi:hypothetical protein Syun_030724 [Stephania yunnanensis]|uniref:AB hydrolase-1 domain-containing protein n=1 Tax=Stephania yunnanensis TaxID=152371 RepID=A0AAP0E062_9MAGN